MKLKNPFHLAIDTLAATKLKKELIDLANQSGVNAPPSSVTKIKCVRTESEHFGAPSTFTFQFTVKDHQRPLRIKLDDLEVNDIFKNINWPDELAGAYEETQNQKNILRKHQKELLNNQCGGGSYNGFNDHGPFGGGGHSL